MDLCSEANEERDEERAFPISFQTREELGLRDKAIFWQPVSQMSQFNPQAGPDLNYCELP